MPEYFIEIAFTELKRTPPITMEIYPIFVGVRVKGRIFNPINYTEKRPIRIIIIIGNKSYVRIIPNITKR